jgi:hypothetical protein
MNEILSTIGGIWESFPAPLTAFITLIAGWMGAIIIRIVVSGVLTLARFDRLSEKAGISEFLRKGGVKFSPAKLVGLFAYWIVLLAALFAVSRALDVRIANALFDRVVEMLPSLLAAIFIVIAGAVIISFLATFVMTIARNAAIPNAPLVSRSIKLVGNILVVTIALDQVGLGKTIISSMFQLLFGAFVFGVALAFGLGCRDLAKDAAQKFLRNLRERERASKGADLEG